jgi:predicted PurR-regulated permease PerM
MLIGASLIIILLGMRATASIIGIVFLALILGISVTPLTGWLRGKGLPAWLALVITILTLILFIVGFVVLIAVSISDLARTLPEYADDAQQTIDALKATLASLGINASLEVLDPSKLIDFVGALLADVVKALSNVVWVLLVLIFVVLDATGFSARLHSGLPLDHPLLTRFGEFTRDIRRYVSITTRICFVVGLVDTVLLLILGVDFAVLWGLLAFLMGYIPSIGFWLAMIPPLILALLELGPTQALIVFLGYVLINGSIQNFVQPKLMGKGLNLSPLFVVLSLFLWAWVLGPLGALLAVPLTMTAKVFLVDPYPEIHWLGSAMSAGDDGESVAGADQEAGGAQHVGA